MTKSNREKKKEITTRENDREKRVITYLTSGNCNKVYEEIKNYVKENPNDEARKAFFYVIRVKDLIEKDRIHSIKYHCLIANLYATTALKEEAIKELNKALRKEKYNDKVICQKGIIRLKIATEGYLWATEVKRKAKQAIKDFENALEINPNNIEAQAYKKIAELIVNNASSESKLREFADKINRGEISSLITTKPQVQTTIQTVTKNTNIVNLETCGLKEVLTLSGFNEVKANKFISLRNSGRKWYNIDALAIDFDLKQHDIFLNKDRLIFPLQPKATKGRRIDF